MARSRKDAPLQETPPPPPNTPEGMAGKAIAETVRKKEAEAYHRIQQTVEDAADSARSQLDPASAAAATAQAEAEDAGNEEERQLGFWELTEFCGRTPQTANARLYINRLDPINDEDGAEVPLDNILTVMLPKSRDAIARIVRGRHGGGMYECIVKDVSTGQVLQVTTDAERIVIDDEAPKFAKKKDKNEINMEIIQAQQRSVKRKYEVEEAKADAELRRIQKEGGGEPDSAMNRKLQELTDRLTIKEIQQANDKRFDELQRQHQEEMRTLRDLIVQNSKPPAEKNELMTTLLTGQQTLMTTLISKMMDTEKTEPSSVLIEMFKAGLQHQGGGNESDGTTDMLKSLVPVAAAVLSQRSQPQALPQPQITPDAVRQMAREEAERQARALPRPSADSRGEHPSDEGDPMIRKIAQQMLDDIKTGKFSEYPSPWLTLFFRSLTPEDRIKFAAAQPEALIALLQQGAPHEFSKLAFAILTRPALRIWIENNRKIFVEWVRKSQEQPAPAPGSNTPPAEQPQVNEEPEGAQTHE